MFVLIHCCQDLIDFVWYAYLGTTIDGKQIHQHPPMFVVQSLESRTLYNMFRAVHPSGLLHYGGFLK